MSEKPTSAPSPERGALVIKRAIELMAAGQAKGWSHALALASAEIR
jgi:hypothetical protein